MSVFKDPADLLQELGIQHPQDIDLEGIAAVLGAKIQYGVLDGCEARIVGRGDRARITVDNRSAPMRRRFSVAHELGHWVNHRGVAMYCRSSEIGSNDAALLDGERQANWYAAHLLMPGYLFRPALSQLARPYTWKKIEAIAKEFNVSPLAAAVRAADEAEHPLVLACYDVRGRRWFKRTSSSDGLFPPDEPDARSGVFPALLGKGPSGAHNVKASIWFASLRGPDQVVEDIHVWETHAYVLLQPAGHMPRTTTVAGMNR